MIHYESISHNANGRLTWLTEENTKKPIGHEALTELLIKLKRRYPQSAPLSEAALKAYSMALAHYSEDIICAAYQHWIIHALQSFPEIRDWLDFVAVEAICSINQGGSLSGHCHE